MAEFVRLARVATLAGLPLAFLAAMFGSRH
jgi:hypothetical protein